MQERDRGLDAAARRRRPHRRDVRALHAAAARAGHRREPPRSSSSRTAGPTSCRSSCRPRSASRRCSRARASRRDKVVGRMRAGPLPRELGVHGRESRGQRRDGGRAAGILAGHPRTRGVERTPRAQGSTTSQTCLSVVNGPIRNEIGMNSGIGAMGPYNHANATIGRAYSLLSQNGQGGSVPGETYMGALGNPLAYSLCFAENEERSPWQPFHVQKGFKPTDSTVTVFFGDRYIQEGFGRARPGRKSSGGAWPRPRISRPAGARPDRCAAVPGDAASIRSRTSSTGAPRMRGFPRATIGTTSGCRR